jgi:hypothetical protein
MILGELHDFVVTLPAAAYALLFAGVAAIMVWLFRHAFVCMRRFRIIEDTPTANIRSAAQGFVEIEGRVAAIAGDPMHSPLRRMPCVWWSYRIEELETGIGHVGDTGWWGLLAAFVLFTLHLFEVRRTGKLVNEGTSGEFFLIRDPTGTCLVDPSDAHVIGAKTKVWTIGEMRYEESVIATGDRLYALGLFHTHRQHLETSEPQEISQLIEEWKQDQEKLVERFDTNKDGRIDQREWEAARAAAMQEVRQRRQERCADPELHILCQPKDRRPFVLSLLSQTRLVNHYWFYCVLSLLGSLMMGVLILWSLSARGTL